MFRFLSWLYHRHSYLDWPITIISFHMKIKRRSFVPMSRAREIGEKYGAALVMECSSMMEAEGSCLPSLWHAIHGCHMHARFVGIYLTDCLTPWLQSVFTGLEEIVGAVYKLAVDAKDSPSTSSPPPTMRERFLSTTPKTTSYYDSWCVLLWMSYSLLVHNYRFLVY